MKKITIFILTIISLSIFANDNNLDLYIKNRNIKAIINILKISDKKNKEKIIDELLKNKKVFAIGQFNLLMDNIKNDYILMDIIDKKSKNYIMDERIFPQLLEYYENNKREKLIDFIVSHQNDELDYWKYAKIFYKKNILEHIAEKTNKKSLLHLYANGIMYSKTNNKKYRQAVLQHDKHQIAHLMTKEIFSEKQKNVIIEETVIKHSILGFEDIIIKNAIYNINNDYFSLLHNSRYINNYSILKKIIKNENYDEAIKLGDLNDSLLALNIFLFNNQRNQYAIMRKAIKAKRNELIYTDCLYYLFNSEYDKFKKSLSLFLTIEKNEHIRLFMIKILLMSNYIKDGTAMKYYALNDFDNLRPILMIIGKDSPMYYEYLIEKKQFEKADSLKEILMNDKNKYANILLINYENGLLEKDDIKDFLINYPDYPFNVYIKELLNE